MTFEPVAAHLAVQLTHLTARSAQPDAPVVPDRAPRPARTASLRLRVAGGLHTAARWVEPSPRQAKACQPS